MAKDIEQVWAELAAKHEGLELEEVRVLRLQPGDIIVARVHEHIPMEHAQRTVERLREFFKGHEVLVCSGFTLEVARPAHSDSTIAPRARAPI